jgi:hypothetical protein
LTVARLAYDALISGRVGIKSRTSSVLDRSLIRLETLIADTLARPRDASRS